jgi:hypothetical protein
MSGEHAQDKVKISVLFCFHHTAAAVRINNRFPLDFMFQLSEEEAAALKSHSATSKTGRGGRRYLPYAFTEHGALMLASILTSTIAVKVSIQIVRAFLAPA